MGRWAIAAAAALLVLPGLAAAGQGPGVFVISISSRAPAGFAELPVAQLEFFVRDAKSGKTTFTATVSACPQQSEAFCSSLSFPQLKTTLRLIDADLDALRGYFDKQLEDGGAEETDCILVARDEQQQVVRTYTLAGCFPIASSGLSIQGQPSEPITETITLAVESYEEA